MDDDSEDLLSETDAYAEVASYLHATIAEQGGGKYRMPWHATVGGRPVNAFNGRPFKGQNFLTLLAASSKSGFQTHQWASRMSWQGKRGRVKRGAEGAPILVPVFDETAPATRWTPNGKRPSSLGPLGGDAAGGEMRVPIGFRRERWFNVAEIEGVVIAPPATSSPTENARRLYAVLEGWRTNQAKGCRGPALAHGGLQAFWRPDLDKIQMPPADSFGDHDGLSGLEYYVAVLAHEHIHATGSKGRLARDTLLKYKGVNRAKEEMVAEIGAAFLAARFGMSTRMRDDHACYVSSWKEAIGERNQQRAFFWAVKQAETAADYILRLGGHRDG